MKEKTQITGITICKNLTEKDDFPCKIIIVNNYIIYTTK